MPPDVSERRRAARREPQPDETVSRVRLRTGRELAVVNISHAGVLVEGVTRLLPGTHVEVHVVTRHGRVLVRTRVMRSSVSRLQADIVSYRTALAFDADLDTDPDGGPGLSERSATNGYPVPAEIPVIPGGEGISYPDSEVSGRV